LQDRVTQSVVGTITPRLENAEINRTRHKPTESLDAYDNYLRGMAEFHQFTQDANKRAVELFTLAYQLDPEYAAAFGMAARTYGQRKGFGWITDHAIEKGEALRLARMATKYGRDDAIALAGAGFALSVFNEANDSDAFLGQALDINPNLAWAWHTRGMSKAILGHPELSVEYSVHALRLSPQDPQQFAMHGICSLGYYLLGRDNEAYLSSDAALRNNPNFLIALAVSAASNAMLGNVENANKAMAHFCTLDPVRCVSNLDQWLDFRRTEDRQRWRDGLILAGLPE
jgi:tetratricopeptide (TPR) repeat protein